MASFDDVLRVLREAGAPIPSGEVASRLWPDRQWRGSNHGGPDGGQRAAAGLLGRLMRRGDVTTTHRCDHRGEPEPPTLWLLTRQGRERADG